METYRVLVVDDEEGMRLGAARVLKSFVVKIPDLEAEVGFETALASTGEEGLELLRSAPPDLLLLDQKLPGIQGLDLLDILVKERPEVLTVMITAYASIETAISATRRGAFDFLAKPFTPEELRSAVHKATKHLILKRRADQLAREKRQVRFQFISVLAHELKAPLASVEGYLQLFRDGIVEPQTPKYDEILLKTIDRVQGMRRMILELLDLTRIESGQKQRSLCEVDLVALAGRCVETASAEASRLGVTLEVKAVTPASLLADAGEVEMILNNLISNAVKYNREGGRVTVALEDLGETVTTSVTDTGIGMTEQDAAKLFGEFVRIKNARTRNIQGTGLGLSIVKKLASLYGGEVSVTSQPDAGSTFTVTLRKEHPADAGNRGAA